MNDTLFVERVLAKLDVIEAQVKELCIRTTLMEEKYNSHIQELNQENEKKLKRRDFGIVIIGTFIAIIEVVRSLGLI